jgi:hypothetical protein
MDVPAFDTSDMTEGGHLLCMRLREGKLESFAWDGTRFSISEPRGQARGGESFRDQSTASDRGTLDAVDKDHCPIGFLWQDGRMRAFPDLIPEEFRSQLRSAIPYLINDSGSILFEAEVKSGPFPEFWPKKTYELELSPDGQHRLSEHVEITRALIGEVGPASAVPWDRAGTSKEVAAATQNPSNSHRLRD